MAEQDDERTLEATPHRRQQAREQGRVAQSHELVSAALLLAGLATMIFAGRSLAEYLANLLAVQLGGSARLSMDADLAITQWNVLIRGLASALLPIVGLLALIALGVNLLQTGFLFLPSRALPDFSRINPLAGLQRMVSFSKALSLMQSLAKAGIIGAVAWQSWYARREEVLNLSQLELPEMATFLWQICLWTCLKIGLALLILAVLDYLNQRWKLERDLRMTPQEVRDELRELEGNPSISRRRRQIRETGPVARVQ